MTFENDDNHVSNPKLEQVIRDGIFSECKKYILPTKLLAYLKFHRNNVSSENFQEKQCFIRKLSGECLKSRKSQKIKDMVSPY